ncbi:hypothetical protein B4N89_00705 [Embleya scabrispora]|uniref:Peptidase n=1 Tax=Embleya scabrispora TaxID=159449 RepID=A0A1T3NSJ4_9ACTN|nr:LPXTG cell wall anchor domain-containing protein [Embleya scabrispora]OPC79660.1 hypothetical protein B4N89_00705 [Embleya scabrispora]
MRPRPTLAATTLCALAGLGITLATAPSAHAAHGTVQYTCQVPFAGDTPAPVTLSLTATPEAPATGQEVTFTWTSEPVPQLAGPAPYDTDSMQTTGTLALAGAHNGTVTMTSPRKNPAVAPGSPVPIGEMTGRTTLTATGRTTVTPGRFVLDVAYKGRTIQVPCEPRDPATVLVLGGTNTEAQGDGTGHTTAIVLGAAGAVVVVTGAGFLAWRRRRTHATS